MAGIKNNEYKLSDDQMKKLHNCTQEILDAFAAVCEENHLRYYLIYGTLLGAIRHNGPIPWDDDADVCMPREDYEKFKRIMLERSVDEVYHIHCFENDQNSPLLLSKMMKKGTVYITGWSAGLDARFKEIWIDVFPLDDLPGYSQFRVRLLGTAIRWMKMLLTTRALKETKDIKPKRKFAHVLLKPIPIRWMYRLAERLTKLCNGKGYKFYVNWGGKYYFKRETMPKEWYGEPVKVLYSGKYYDAPCQWDKVLTHLYGDYMKLPPEEERVGHDPIEFKV